MADIFNEDGKYNKTDWESGDRITANKLNRIEIAIEQINDNDNQRHVEADGRLDSLEAGLTETKDKVDNIDMAYKTADTVLTNRVNSVETSYKAADTTLNNRVNSVETAYKTSETNLTNKFNNLNTAYQNAVSNLTAKFNSLETAYKAADTKMTNNINNLDAAYKAADVEIQNSIPTKTTQLENDAAYITEEAVAPNLIRNGIFAGRKTDYWWSFGDFWKWDDSNYYKEYKEGDIWIANQKKRDISSWPGSRGGIFTNAISVEPGEVYTFSTQVRWEGEVKGIGVYIEFYYNGEYKQTIEYRGTNTNSGEREIFVSDITKRQTITFTVPSDTNEVMVGLIHEGCFIEAPEGAYLVNFRFPCLKKGHSTEWTPHKYDICTQPGIGSWFNNGTPIVGHDGVMEIGKAIDFHHTNDSTGDHSARLMAGNGDLSVFANIIPDGDQTRVIGRSDLSYVNMYSSYFTTPFGSFNGYNGLVQIQGTDQNIATILQSKTTAGVNCFRPEGNNVMTLGHSAHRWGIIYLVASPDVSSDRTVKENIQYIKNENAKAVSTDEVVTYKDMYDFVKDDLELAIYNIKDNDKQQMNFIAQDLLYNIDGSDNKVGQMIVKPIAPPPGEDPDMETSTLSYDSGMYTSVLAGALKEALNKIDKLEDEIKELKNK